MVVGSSLSRAGQVNQSRSASRAPLAMAMEEHEKTESLAPVARAFGEEIDIPANWAELEYGSHRHVDMEVVVAGGDEAQGLPILYPGTPNVLFQDEHIVVFVDRNPSAYRHYLVVPNNHIKTVKDLQPGETDHALVTHMLKLGRSTLQRDAPDAPNYRLGFHRPPFNSVDHLHLHCMALPYNSVWRRMKYVGLGWWGAYVSVERVLQYLDPGKGMKPGVPLGEQPDAPV